MTEPDVSITEAIEKAAVSPDPAVRGAAIHYRSLQQELAGLEAFFSFYGQVRSDAAPAAPAAASKQRTAPRGKVAVEFISRVRELLVKTGTPMRTSLLYQRFYEVYPDQKKIDAEGFRQRLARHRSLIRHWENTGYWPADLPLPSAGTDLHAVS